MKTSGHFNDDVSNRPDRVNIRTEWIELARDDPEFREIQKDDRVRHWIFVSEEDRWLRVVLLSDWETVHTAFWDRRFTGRVKRFEDGQEPQLRRER